MGGRMRNQDSLEADAIFPEAQNGIHTYSDGSLMRPEPVSQWTKTKRFFKDPIVQQACKNLLLIAIWYFFSTLLSLWNKIIVGKDHGVFGKGAFPAPFFMSAIQFMFQYIIARFLLAFGFVKRRSEEELSWNQYLKTVIPNGIATGLDIGFSNYSLVFITLSFYVMCKSTTPLFLLSFAFMWGLEKPSWNLAAVVAIISAGLILLVFGETQFHLVGFLLVMTAAALSGLRWTITQVLLQGSKHHSSTGGPVEVIYQLTPIMSLALGTLSLSFEKLWNVLPGSPYFDTVGHVAFTIGIIWSGAIIAFAMVWAEFTLISNTSALTFMVAGTLKEIVTVGAAVLIFHDAFTPVNALGLLVLIGGVVLFNVIKYRKMRQGELEIQQISLNMSDDEGDDDIEGVNAKETGPLMRNDVMRNDRLERRGSDVYTSGTTKIDSNHNSSSIGSPGGGGVGSMMNGNGVNSNSSRAGSDVEMAAQNLNLHRPPTPVSPGGGGGQLSRRMSGGADKVVEELESSGTPRSGGGVNSGGKMTILHV